MFLITQQYGKQKDFCTEDTEARRQLEIKTNIAEVTKSSNEIEFSMRRLVGVSYQSQFVVSPWGHITVVVQT